MAAWAACRALVCSVLGVLGLLCGPGWRCSRCKRVVLGSGRAEQNHRVTGLPSAIGMHGAMTDNLAVQSLRFRQRYRGFRSLFFALVWCYALLEIPKQYEFSVSASPKYRFTL